MLKGNKDTIMEYFNVVIIVLIILAFVAVTGLIAQISQNSNFSNFAEGVVSRHGGLTSSAVTEIEKYSEDYYGGRYTVEGCVVDGIPSMDNCIPLRYGETVEFVIKGQYNLSGVNLPMKLDLRINAVSRRR